MRRPVVLIDSGSSVGESMFLAKIRQWLLHSIEERLIEKPLAGHKWTKPTCYILYPSDRHASRYGVYPCNEYDAWEIRPIRWRGRPLAKGGIMSTVANFEEGCFRLKIPAPWRNLNTKNLRAAYVYFNPDRREVAWIDRHHEKFRKVYNVPTLVLGHPLGYQFPVGALEWCSHLWAMETEFGNEVNRSTKPGFSKRLLWEKLWPSKRKIEPTVALAGHWGDLGTLRSPEMARDWIPPELEVVEFGGSEKCQDLEAATDCGYYVIASSRETVPFDAMIAAAKGSVLIAPNTPAFTWIPGRKILYPARDAGNGIISWNPPDVASLIFSKLKHGRSARNPKS